MSGPIPIHRRTGKPKSPDINYASLAALAVAGVVIAGLFTCWFQVGPESVGVIRRLGKHNKPDREPGFHFRLPFGIDKVDIVQVERQLKEEFGFRTELAGETTRYSAKDYSPESLMLTGDLNVAVVEWSVQYRIVDPYRYLFKVRNPTYTFRYMAQAVMREVVGDRTVTEILTVGRQELASTVETKMQELCDQYEIGLRVEEVILQNITPPNPVRESFNEVNQAQQERERLISEARAEYNREVPKAEGLARQTLERAEGYAVDRTNRAKGDANRFLALVAEYQKAPEVTRRRVYLETMGAVLPNVGRKVVVDHDAGGVLKLLDLGELAGLGGPLAPAGQSTEVPR